MRFSALPKPERKTVGKSDGAPQLAMFDREKREGAVWRLLKRTLPTNATSAGATVKNERQLITHSRRLSAKSMSKTVYRHAKQQEHQSTMKLKKGVWKARAATIGRGFAFEI